MVAQVGLPQEVAVLVDQETPHLDKMVEAVEFQKQLQLQDLVFSTVAAVAEGPMILEQ